MDLLIEVVENGAWVHRARHFDTESDLGIDENGIDGEACGVGKQLLYYGDAFAELKAEVARKKEMVERIGAIVALKLRSTLDKPTEGKIKESVVTDTKYQGAKNDLLAAEANLLRVEAWYRSIQRKVDLIVMLGYKQNREIKATQVG